MNFEAMADFSIGGCYIAGFAQAREPHVGVLVPTTATSGTLVHIRIDRAASPNWELQIREQKIAGDMFLTSLLKIAEPGAVSVESLIAHAEQTPVPSNDEFGECFPWAITLVERLRVHGLVKVKDMDGLQAEFRDFVGGNRQYARRDRFPNVASSAFCGL
ncbi:hypothetical protein VNI00_015979 [Paramarasmius palmivorus]|uniref:Uncharacterized protein n=1 Tax=Paramarasmius palmivorus TaxID=297713 RepID=A0AAW0BHW9_9AGAR